MRQYGAGPNASLVVPALAAVLAWLMSAAGASAQEAPPPEEPIIVLRPVPAGPPPEPLPPQDPRFSVTFSGGYSRVEADGDSILDGEDGWYFDFDFAGRASDTSPLWLGVGIGGSYYDQSEEARIESGVFPTFVEVDAAMSLFTIEPRATFVVLPREDRGLYLAGRLGAGLLIADYWATGIVERPAGIFIDGDGETVFAFEVRPAAQLGFCGGPWVLGAEVSQMWAWGDFDPLGDQLTETRFGIFFTLRH
jgi:hypothetical protein